MLRIDWRSPADYRHANKISAADFAWEYLRRNHEYRQDFQKMTDAERLGPDRLEAFARRWGLRFPERSRRRA